MKLANLVVNGVTIRRVEINGLELICLTDMRQGFPEHKSVEKWIRASTVQDFLSSWERFSNPNFKDPTVGVEYEDTEKIQMSVGSWIKQTNAIGLYVEKGRTGGTYAWVDIATKFAMFLSSDFEVKLIIEHRKLLEASTKQLFTSSRLMASSYYADHAVAVDQFIIQPQNLSKYEGVGVYCKEANLLNLLVFGKTAKEWRDMYPELAKGNKNQRDYATPIELLVIYKLEVLNSVLVEEGMTYDYRYNLLKNKTKQEKEKLAKMSENKLLTMANAIR